MVISYTIFASSIHSDADVEAQIVAYSSESLRQCLQEINVEMDSVKIFPTMGDVLKFYPTEDVIGDEVFFLLDGSRQIYKIDSFDTQQNKYNLIAISKLIPTNIPFEAIPLIPTFMFRHYSTNVVNITQYGNLSKEYYVKSGEGNLKPETPIIKIKYISNTDNESKLLK